MLERYRFHKPNPSNKVELKAVLEGSWADIPHAPIDKAILAFRKRLGASVNEDGKNFEHQLHQLSFAAFILMTFFRVTKIIQKVSQRD